jgi:hypothetical protein
MLWIMMALMALLAIAVAGFGVAPEAWWPWVLWGIGVLGSIPVLVWVLKKASAVPPATSVADQSKEAQTVERQ